MNSEMIASYFSAIFGASVFILMLPSDRLLDKFGYKPGPTGLMGGAQPGTVVAMKVFMIF